MIEKCSAVVNLMRSSVVMQDAVDERMSTV
jgi:hypothetical protein